MSQPELQYNGWISVPWAEWISKGAGRPTGSTSDCALSYGSGNQAVYSILVGFSDGAQACVDLLGSNLAGQAAGVATGLISRTPAVRHPYFSHLRAEKITAFRGVQWNGKQEFNDVEYQAPFSTYTYWLISILFTQPHYVVLTDAELDSTYGSPRQEYRRYVSYLPQPASEVITRDAGVFRWSESGPVISGSSALPPTQGQPFTAPTAQYLSKVDYIFSWMRVPYLGFYNAQNQAVAQLAALNHVNDATFMGFPAGTLLFKGYRVTNNESPFPPEFFGFNSTIGQPSLVVDVEFQFSYFNPPSGNNVYFGHNLAPQPPIPSGSSYTAVDQKWYRIATDATNSSPGTSTLFPSIDFSTIFTMNI